MNLRRLLAVFFIYTAGALAQLGAPSGSGGGTTSAAQLPVSGRNGQNGSVTAAETPIPGTTSSVNTLNTTVQAQGPYAGSRDGAARQPFSGKLSLREAVARGLAYNLGTVGMGTALRQSQGQAKVARSALLPQLNGNLRETVLQENLRALGLRVSLPFPGFNFPTIVGPFNYFDLRATLTQNVADMTALNNYRTSKQIQRANEFAAQDARDLVVLAVGGAYLQVIAAQARVASAQAQLETARALLQQVTDQRKAGLMAQIDVNRAQVQAETQEQRVDTLKNDLSKQKINLARLTGLAATEAYEITDQVAFSAAPSISADDALKQALADRADLKSADAQVKAAEKSKAAAQSERLPSLSLSADYGAIGVNPSQSHGTFTVTGQLKFPIWTSGKIDGDIEQADAALEQRRAEMEDERGRIESDVRNAFLDLQAAGKQVHLAESNQEVTRQNLELTRQRFQAGITDSVEVTQARDAVAGADLDYISAVFAHNLAKLSLARAMGKAEEKYPGYLGLK
jgi:outer membrane protein TolC